MDFIPNRLLLGIRDAKSSVPNLANGNSPTTTTDVVGSKVTHALGKLAQAGVANDAVTSVLGLPTTTSTRFPEKITHAAEKLTSAGLSSDSTPSSATKHSSGLATKYIIVIAVVSAVVLLVLLTGGCMCWRRYKRRRAYNMVSRGVDKKGKGVMREKEDMFNADMGEAESFNVDGQKLTERNFESGYDKVDTGYEGTGYGAVEEHGDEHGGDKRARLEA
ncbi:uncharacterized protein Z520_00386 [Fonsecaea multimorphosa CBS 102226]|uniref:Mid2 domain-containing protein n=1 Tax=Fonsecaea multimorphosa CBS 102226 TaxID=1442371 RepID=A0A0D2KJN6_9EURO|nr:uncharacterized protein Z520_00386 [Fonsecaea multimorphosa CBS 102226]KIY03695.1 hypothetical protein Z520_00386 [Fonsecaea multimorphosa CBS 102226]OAL32394.1 hypothetical protein AYO22_00416 [Fonsecaea multimorphosa]